MRTTVNIDDRLLEWAKDVAREREISLGDVVDEALQRLLMHPIIESDPELPVYRPKIPGFLPGVDPLSNQSLFDAADDPAAPLK